MGADPQLADFCRTEWPRLVGSLGLYVGDRGLAEDLAQETLVRVCQHWSKARGAASPSAWAHRVAFNLAKSEFRRRAVRRSVDAHAGRELVAIDPDASVRIAVERALAELPDVQRRAVVLRYFADFSVRQVASIMRCPANTVKTHTRRAIESMRSDGLLVDEPEPRPRWATGGAS